MGKSYGVKWEVGRAYKFGDWYYQAVSESNGVVTFKPKFSSFTTMGEGKKFNEIKRKQQLRKVA
jgi:hypothetical protein